MGYSALRLCSISQELVSDEWIELDDNDNQDISEPCTWSLVFNLTIPGWLPSSTEFGDRDGGTKYALHASAIVHNTGAPPSRTWLSTLCLPFQPQTRMVKAERVIVPLHRHATPSLYASTSTSPFPVCHYEVSAQPEDICDNTEFPRDVLSKIRVQTTIPECIDMDSDQINFSIRLRTKGLSEHQCKRLCVRNFDIDVEQSERYRCVESSTQTICAISYRRRMQKSALPNLLHSISCPSDRGTTSA
jgi:hypothetical protein